MNTRLKPGRVRDLRWHKEAECAYMLASSARVTAIDQDGRNFNDDVVVGELCNLPKVCCSLTRAPSPESSRRSRPSS